MDKNQPLYLVPSHDPMVKEWEANFRKLENGNLDLSFTVNPDIVHNNEVAYIQQMVLALQHYPHLIEKMLFAVTFRFRLVDDVGVEVSEDDWKENPEVYRWFFSMFQLPIIIFFIKDHDARFYTLTGDMLTSGNLTYVTDDDGNTAGVQFSEDQMQVFADRIFTSCWAFLLYCHGTGFNPDSYIDAVLADYSMPFTTLDVRKKYEADIERGIATRVVPQDRK